MLQIIAEAISTLTRPAVTIMLVATLCYLAVRGGVTVTSDQILPVVTMVIGFWFGTKTAENVLAKGSTTNVTNVNPSSGSTSVSNTSNSPIAEGKN